MPCPKASCTICRTGCGSEAGLGSSAPAPAPVGTIPTAASPAAVYVATRCASSAPSAETPTAPPRLRKNVTVELAAPRSLVATTFWVASTRFCIIMPSPAPSTSM